MKSSITQAPQRRDPLRSGRGEHGDAGAQTAPRAPRSSGRPRRRQPRHSGQGLCPGPPARARTPGSADSSGRGRGGRVPSTKKNPPALTAIGGGGGRAPFCLLGFVLLVLLPHGEAAAGPAGSAGAGGPSRPPRRKIRVRGRPCLAQRALYKQRLPQRVPGASGSPALAIPVAPARRSRGRACLR